MGECRAKPTLLDTRKSTICVRDYNRKNLLPRVQKMKLLISEKIIDEISQFAMQYGAQGVLPGNLEIRVSFSKVSINFFQPERYCQLVACCFEFGNDVGFFFEDVFSAIEGHPDTHQAIADEQPASVDVLKRNDSYVHHIVEYCEKNIDLIVSVPPPWFQRAVSIADAATRKNFPSLANEDMSKKQELWDAWQLRNRH
jgi:hypothetical protein